MRQIDTASCHIQSGRVVATATSLGRHREDGRSTKKLPSPDHQCRKAMAKRLHAIASRTPDTLAETRAQADCSHSSLHYRTSDVPDFGCIFRNGAVAGESAGARNVEDCFTRPAIRVGIQCAEPFLCLAIGSQVRQMHVAIASRQERVAQRTENSWLVPAKKAEENQIQCRAGLRLVLIVPMRVVPAAAILHLLHGEIYLVLTSPERPNGLVLWPHGDRRSRVG